jgi:hypothetical protein
MPTNYPAGSSNGSSNYLLYSHYKALDQVQELGLIPVRLFRVLFPLWRVRVVGDRRVVTEFDELEWYLERGLLEAGFSSVADLAAFFGLEPGFARRLVNFARAAGHISGDDSSLALTELGQASVRDRVRYEQHTSSQEFYFDALGNRPLTPEHDKIPIVETLPEKTPFQAFHHFEHTWEPEALSQLPKSPDGPGYYLPEGSRDLRLVSPEPAYMPAYFVEAREKKPNSPLRLLVFSQVRGLHDLVLEDAVNRDPTVYRALKAKTDSRAEAVRKYFEHSGLKKDAWYLNENGPWGAQVMVDGQVFLPGTEADEDEAGRLSIRSVGRYSLIYDWCIWVVCDNSGIRKQAATEQLLDWLQNVNATPTGEEIRRKWGSLCQRLSIQDLPLSQVLTLARERGLTRAAHRLDELEED